MELTPWREAAQRGLRTFIVLLIGIGVFAIASGDHDVSRPVEQHMTVTPVTP